MRKIVFVFVACLSYFNPTFSQSTFPQSGIRVKNDIYTLFKNARVHQSPLKTDTLDILIYKNRIVACGKTADMEIPENTVVRNIAGYDVFPSFIELNSSYGISLPKGKDHGRGPEYERMQNKADSWNDAIHPERKAVRYFMPDTTTADTLRSLGFGIVLSQINDGIIRGTSLVASTGNGSANDNVMVTEAGMHFSFRKGKSIQDYPSSLMGTIALLRQTFYDLQWYEKADQRETNYSLEALGKARSLPYFFEAGEKYDIRRLAKIAKEFDQNYIVYGAGDSYQLRKINFPGLQAIVAPLNFPKPFDMSDPDLSRLIDQQDLMAWEWAPFNPFFIQQSGIRLALSGKGISDPKRFFTNLRKCVTYGLQKDSALAALTTIPAQILGVDNQVGRIENGYRADFFISKGDVFTDKDAEISEHWINGKQYIVHDSVAVGLAGNYTLNVNDTYYTLIVNGDKPYQATVLAVNNNDTLKFKANLSQQSNQVSLQFRVDSSGGYFRLGGTILSDNRIWDGRGITPQGDYINWNAIRRREKGTKSTPLQKVKSDTIPILPKTYFPFKAYGLDSIPGEEMILFTNATIWTNDSIGILKNASMLIGHGKIIAVGKNINPDDFMSRKDRNVVKRVDLRGKHISAGIIDEHSHIAISRGVNERTQACTAEVRVSDALNPDDINIYRQLAGGVTTAQLLHGSSNPIGGQSAIIKLKWGAGFDQMVFDKAPGFIKFALGENVKQSNRGPDYTSRYPQTRMGVEQFYYDNFYRAREYGQLKKLSEARKETAKKRRKKSEPKAEPFHTDLEMEALLQVLTGKRFITCHSYVQSEINMLIHVADSMGFRINTFTHALEAYKVADKLKSHGACCRNVQ